MKSFYGHLFISTNITSPTHSVYTIPYIPYLMHHTVCYIMLNDVCCKNDGYGMHYFVCFIYSYCGRSNSPKITSISISTFLWDAWWSLRLLHLLIFGKTLNLATSWPFKLYNLSFIHFIHDYSRSNFNWAQPSAKVA